LSRRRDELVMYHVAKVTEDLYVLRVDDRYTKYFEALWEIPEGITYNAYLLKTDEGDVLFDAWKRQFSSHLMEALERVTSPDRLKYVVVHHMEPDHTGSLEDVLRWAPNAKVLGHPLAGRMMNAYPKAKERFKPVKDGEVLEVGGKKLRFVHTPWLHWPETMMTWLEEEGVLLTCDAFGGYGIPLSLFDDQCVKLEEMIREMRKYVVTVIGHYREWIDRNIAKLEKLGIKVDDDTLMKILEEIKRSNLRFLTDDALISIAEKVSGKVLRPKATENVEGEGGQQRLYGLGGPEAEQHRGR